MEMIFVDRTILHSDLNSFYASVECLYRPEIRDKPVTVAGRKSMKITADILHQSLLQRRKNQKQWQLKLRSLKTN